MEVRVLPARVINFLDPLVSITTSNRANHYRPGELIFDDEFDDWDSETWSHELTVGGNDVRNFFNTYEI